MRLSVSLSLDILLESMFCCYPRHHHCHWLQTNIIVYSFSRTLWFFFDDCMHLPHVRQCHTFLVIPDVYYNHCTFNLTFNPALVCNWAWHLPRSIEYSCTNCRTDVIRVWWIHHAVLNIVPPVVRCVVSEHTITVGGWEDVHAAMEEGIRVIGKWPMNSRCSLVEVHSYHPLAQSAVSRAIQHPWDNQPDIQNT